MGILSVALLSNFHKQELKENVLIHQKRCIVDPPPKNKPAPQEHYDTAGKAGGWLVTFDPQRPG